MKMTRLPDTMTIAQVAEKSGFSRQTIYAHEKMGMIRAVRIGRNVRFHVRDVKNYLDGQKPAVK